MKKELCEEWMEAEEQRKAWAKKELALRLEICNDLFNVESSPPGEYSCRVGSYAVTATAKQNTYIDDDAVAEMWDDLTAEEQACFKLIYKFSETKINKLKASVLKDLLTHKPARPSLEITSIAP